MLRAVRTDMTILEQLRQSGVLMESPCNGKGLCGKCKVRIMSGEVSPLTEQEKKLLKPEELENGIRLACIAVPVTPLEIDPMGLIAGKEGAVLGGGEMPKIPLAPAVSAEIAVVEPATLENGFSLCDTVKGLGDAPLSLIRKVTEFPGESELSVILYDGHPIDLRNDNAIFGLAVDIGTTTVALSLVDLHTGEILCEDGFLNPQKAFGLDVLSRIHYDIEHPGGVKKMQQAIVQRIHESAASMAQRIGVSIDSVYEAVIGGNSTMLHALLGVPLASLGRAPYSSVFTHAVTVSAKEIGMELNEQARVYCIPSVSTYIGGDIVSGVLSARLDEAKDTVLFIDIGTNGEIVLSRAGKMYSCSCAAGPALEGMNISCGMRAEPGAIERVTVTDGTAEIRTIGGETPCGLCGSGILEAVSELVKDKAIARTGRISATHPLAVTDEEGKRRILLDEQHKIYITQGDIRQVQLCKGAILSGILTLLERLELTPSDIDRVLVAGQFGKHLNEASLVGAGLIPKELEERIHYIGNSSRMGAQMCLLSQAERKRAEQIACAISYVELSVSPGYDRLFASSMQFGG